MWIYRQELAGSQGEVRMLENGTIAGRLDEVSDFDGDEVIF
jgi:hypothetical protein